MIRLAFAGLSLLLLGTAVSASAAETQPRERILIDNGWRFTMGDPADAPPGLFYDVRPQVKQSADGKAADARPDEAEKLDAAKVPVLKPWILPTGNAFLKDPAKRYVRPVGDPGRDVSYVSSKFDDRSWQAVTLPHDWAIKGPFLATGPYGGMGRLPSWGVGWYRKALDIPARDAGMSIFLDIDGAMSYAVVWLNGRLVGGWPYGYNSWRLDLTPYVVPGGVNQLAVRLDNPPESSRWYPGGGLYRNVWLTKTAPVRVGQWGVFVRTPEVSAKTAKVEIDVAIDNGAMSEAAVEVRTELYALNAVGRLAGAAVARLPPIR
ncbi:MAG TPA: beta-galactosidase, partial [Caulobacter sp.]|nr:beta-galactosidase [Caulobacter sp.]